MLAGEYLVSRGMEGLAFPVKAGQWLKVWETYNQGNGKLIWQAAGKDGQIWFKAEIDTDIMHISATTQDDTAKTLIQLLQTIKNRIPDFFEHKTFRIETELEFDKHSGLGTSSTLVVLLSQWSGVNPFELQKEVFGGSAYDIAVCQTGKPIVYWLSDGKPCWAPFSLNTEWTGNWNLVFPGTKVNSREALVDTDEKAALVMTNPMFRWQLEQILKGLKSPGNKMMLEAGLEMWQGMLSTFLGLKRTYDNLGIVPVPGGLCKYLGAWGGDVMVVNNVVLELYAQKFNGMEVVSWNKFVITG